MCIDIFSVSSVTIRIAKLTSRTLQLVNVEYNEYIYAALTYFKSLM